jgi:penicillin-binding protein 1A
MDNTTTPVTLKERYQALGWLARMAISFAGLAVAGFIALAIFVGIALAVAYPNLPDIAELQDYRPKLPLRVYSSEGALIGEFGEERRQLTRIKDFPSAMKEAILAAEDARFYEHGGVDYVGVLRAGVTNLWNSRAQGASTITMQVARNVYLTSERTLTRKIYELLLTFKLEAGLSKDQILEIYMNQIFLGHRAYGFAAASEAYFGKPIKDITIAEAAMLAGLPKAPSAFNPISNPKRARSRQLYIIERMHANDFITEAQMVAAKAAPLVLKTGGLASDTPSEYVAEMARQLVFAQYGEETYTRGLNVYTTIKADQQLAAYKALRAGIMDYERRQAYRGPEEFIDLSPEPKKMAEELLEAFQDHPDNGDIYAAVVMEVNPKKIVAERSNGESIEITGDGLKPVQSGLSDKASPKIKIIKGAVIRVAQTQKKTWEVTQLPEVEGAFVAVNPQSGAIQALVGGFDFQKSKFNHVTQAWRQPGSSFKPFIYSAALEKGFTPSTIVNDAPLFFDAGATGSQPWEPKNYDGKFDGPMTLRRGLALSKNMVSIRVLQATGAQFAQEWIGKFGFDMAKHPAYLTMALGAGSVTPLQMAAGYSVFANGGYLTTPWLIQKITDERGKTLVEVPFKELQESPRAIDARNAYLMSSLLQEVTRSGTAAKARVVLKRDDVYGKTGTTNDSHDAWFAGYSATVAAVTWIGYDNPRKLGDKETGGGLSLPVWISFMQTALKGAAVAEMPVPEGIVNRGGEWYFDEYTKGTGVTSLGLDGNIDGGSTAASGSGNSNGTAPATAPKQTSDQEKKSILDMFRN